MTHGIEAVISLMMIGVGAWGVIRVANALEQRAVAATGGDEV